MQLGDIVAGDKGFGFSIRDTVTGRDLYTRWHEVLAWWLIATFGFSGGYFTANLMHSAVSGQIPQRMRQFLIAVGVLILAGAGQAASAPSPIPTISGVLAGLAALCLGAVMAFCGAYFALRKV